MLPLAEAVDDEPEAAASTADEAVAFAALVLVLEPDADAFEEFRISLQLLFESAWTVWRSAAEQSLLVRRHVVAAFRKALLPVVQRHTRSSAEQPEAETALVTHDSWN